jgi:hypothetical protein
MAWILFLCFVTLVGVGVFFLLSAFHRRQSIALTVQDGHVVESRWNQSLSIEISKIKAVCLASEHDVYPFGYCWILIDESGRKISFFGRDDGASLVLQALQDSLKGFSKEQAIAENNRVAALTEFVDVWVAK